MSDEFRLILRNNKKNAFVMITNELVDEQRIITNFSFIFVLS